MKKLLLFTLLLPPMLAQAQIIKPPKVTGGGTGTAVDVVNNLNQATTGKALDATQGVALKNMVAAKLNVTDTTSFIRKITGWRLISPTEINKLANLTGVNSGDQTLSFNNGTLTISGSNGNSVSIPVGGGSSTPNTLSVGTVTTGAPGSQAVVTITGTAPNQTINLTIPQGLAGTAGTNGTNGSNGATGATPTFTIGTITTGAAGSQASATITGTSPNLVLNLTLPQGAIGQTGATGAAGAAGATGATGATGAAGTNGTNGTNGVTPAFTIGTVTTLAAGANATASVTGSATNPVLNLGLPQGAAGTGGGGALPILYITDPASFANSAAGYNYIQYDGSVWVRSSGNVDTNTDNNPKYTALQYNAGSDHFDRQYSGYAMFGWWRNSSGNRWQQLKYAINHTVGAKIQVEDGTYDFTENAFSPGNFEVRGNLVDPSRVVFRAVSSQTMIFNGWFWYDGITDGQRFENILIHGIRFVQASTATTNTSRGPITFEGGSQNNITIRRCEYLQQSTTAITNFFFTKSGANLKTQNITFEENRSVNPTTKGRMMYEAINQDHPNNDKGIGTNIKIRRNYIDGFNYGFSVAGNFDNTLVDDNDIGNCDNYGNEFAGSNTNATLSNNRFFGTHNVLWASNYHGETGGSDGDYPITAGSGQHYINNHTVGKISGGYVEIRGGGIVEFVGNDLRMDGGILFLQTSLGGVTGGIMQRNQIISSMTNTNWRNQTTNLIFFNGANNVKVSSNYFERGGTDASAVVQVNSNGLTNTGNLFFQNILQTGANGTYFGAASTSTIRVGNINSAGTAVN